MFLNTKPSQLTNFLLTMTMSTYYVCFAMNTAPIHQHQYFMSTQNEQLAEQTMSIQAFNDYQNTTQTILDYYCSDEYMQGIVNLVKKEFNTNKFTKYEKMMFINKLFFKDFQFHNINIFDDYNNILPRQIKDIKIFSILQRRFNNPSYRVSIDHQRKLENLYNSLITYFCCNWQYLPKDAEKQYKWIENGLQKVSNIFLKEFQTKIKTELPESHLIKNIMTNYIDEEFQLGSKLNNNPNSQHSHLFYIQKYYNKQRRIFKIKQRDANGQIKLIEHQMEKNKKQVQQRINSITCIPISLSLDIRKCLDQIDQNYQQEQINLNTQLITARNDLDQIVQHYKDLDYHNINNEAQWEDRVDKEVRQEEEAEEERNRQNVIGAEVEAQQEN